MKTNKLSRVINVLTVFMIAILGFGTQSALAVPPAPVPISPLGGSTIIIPTFSWQAATGAAQYVVEVGAQSDPVTILWSDQTVNLNLTPNNGSIFANIPLFWRVRALDSGGTPGAWSSTINFTKQIPAPVLVSPTDTSSVVTPIFEWQAVQGAAYYKVELSASSTFLVVDETYQTYNTRVTPTNTIPNGLHYWRVTGFDADGHAGTPSPGWTFTKGIPAPSLVGPYNGHPNVHIPAFSWTAVDGAAYYKVELSTVKSFVPVAQTYTTYNTSVTPVDSIPNILYYWRVSGVDADGHVGTPSSVWTFTKNTDAPVLISPDITADITTPTMSWAPVIGAASYKVELSANSDFLPILETYSTYNLSVTPVDLLPLAKYYWRVSSVDPGGNVGGSYWRWFTLLAPSAAIDPVPLLLSPTPAQTITSDPTFSWTRVVGAADYRLKVYKDAELSVTHESILTDYASYTPYAAGTHDAYPNGTYYWYVEARNASLVVIATSSAQSFTKQEILPLVSPTNGAGLDIDPTFEWGQIVGAADYRLLVSTFSDFHSTYESILTESTSYRPYTPGDSDAYPNGTYYWKVEARNANLITIATSEARSLTKQEVQPLTSPTDGATGLLVDPTFRWEKIIGAKDYRLIVSTFSDFHSSYETILTEYTSYTPFTPGDTDAYPNGTYYWKVEARNASLITIATSTARSLTKQEPLPLIAPTNGARLNSDPTFQWSQVVGAKDYRLIVSKYADFHAAYDNVLCDYPTYTPYIPSLISPYVRTKYYWKVEARNSSLIVIATSNSWTFDESVKIYLPITLK